MIEPLAKQIRQLDSLLRRLTPPRRQLIDLKSPIRSGARTGAVLEFVRSNPDCVDQEIAESIGLPDQSQAFHALKSSILLRLVNGLFLLDLKRYGYSDHGVKMYKNNKLAFAVKVLVFLGQRDVATALASRGLVVAERLELAGNCVDFLRTLQHSAVLQGDEKRLKLLRKKSEWWIRVLAAEFEMEGVFNSISIRGTTTALATATDKERVFLASLEAEKRYKTFKTFWLALMSFRLRALNYQTREDYFNCIAVCREAEEYIHTCEHHRSDARIAEFAVKRLTCSIHLRDLNEGLNAAKMCDVVYKEASINWFVLQESLFLLYCSVLGLQEARTILNRATGSIYFKDLPVFRREKWLIFELYLSFAEGKLDLIQRLNSDVTPTFNDFIKWVPSYAQDKAGYNAAVLILHVLFLISKGEWAAVGERVGALESYRVKHLKRANKQANIFVLMLIEVSKSDFTLKEVEVRTGELHSKLLDTIDSDLANTGVQIFPFEWLWQKVLDNLK